MSNQESDKDLPLQRADMALIALIIGLAILHGVSLAGASWFGAWFSSGWVTVWIRLITAAALLHSLIRLQDARFLPSILLITSAVLAITGAGFLVTIEQSTHEGMWPRVFTLAGYAMIALAVIWLPATQSRFSSRALVATDVAISLGAIALLIWELFIWPARDAQSMQGGLLQEALNLGYPTLMLALLVALLIKGKIGQEGPHRDAFRILTLACCLFFLGDAATSSSVSLRGQDTLQILAELARGGSLAAFCAAGFLYRGSTVHGQTAEVAPRNRLERSLSPISIVCMGALLLLMLVKVGGSAAPSPLLVVGAVVLMLLVLGRQTVMTVRNQNWLRDYQQELEQQVKERTDELAIANDKLQELANKDGLTQLFNRRSFEQALEENWLHQLRTNTPLTLAILDVDFFKRFNDNYGHPEGDECLRQLARVLEASVRRQTDMVARYGGEEFVVLMPHTTLTAGIQVMNGVREALKRQAIPHTFSDVADVVTISIGVASTEHLPGASTPAELLTLADMGLYRAKQDGRDRVAVHQSEESGESQTQ